MTRVLVLFAATLAAYSLMSCAAAPPAAVPAATPQPSPSAQTGTSGSGTSRTATIALYSADNPAQVILKWQPLADRLATSLSRQGFVSGDVKVAPDTAAVARWLSDGSADVYSDSMNDAFNVMEQSGAVPLLRRWKGGSGEYSTVIFAKKGSGITSLSQLRGQVLALQEPGSTSGYVLPVTHLLKQGLNVTRSESSTPGPNEVGYTFTWQDDKTIQSVLSGQAKAGAIDAPRYAKLGNEVKDGLAVLAETEAAPRGMLIARKDLPPDAIASVKGFFSGLSEDPDGRAILAKIGLDKFDEFPEGEQKAIARMKELQRLLDKR